MYVCMYVCIYKYVLEPDLGIGPNYWYHKYSIYYTATVQMKLPVLSVLLSENVATINPVS